jgi:hypothetical protein
MFEVLKTYFSPSTRIGGPATRKLKNSTVSTPTKPYLSWLLAFYGAWKLLLLAVACASPGPGYDTSTSILFDRHGVEAHSWVSGAVEHLTLRLTRWDALYFSTSSARGHLYEQEWAFSWFMARLTAILADGALLHLVIVVIFQAKYYIQRFHRFFTRRLSSDMPLAAYSPLMFPTWEQ